MRLERVLDMQGTGRRRDGTGPHGRGMGPGRGRRDGSGLEGTESSFKECLAAALKAKDAKDLPSKCRKYLDSNIKE